MYDVIIIGSGPAGLTAAIYTSRAKLKTLVLEASVMGGTAATTDDIDNYPGFPDGINGSDLMEYFKKQAERFGTEIKFEQANRVVNTSKYKKVICADTEYQARTVLIAVGAKRKELGVPGEKEFTGRGVSYCATCDGAFFQDVPVAVVGGGDSAVKEALYLSKIASKVILIHRRDQLRANQTAVDKLMNTENIEVKLNRTIKRIEGNSLLERLFLQEINGEEEVLEAEGLFVSIGLIPASDFVNELVDTQAGYILANQSLETSIEGIFAAGDIRVKEARQIATAVGDGAQAGMSIVDYLKK